VEHAAQVEHRVVAAHRGALRITSFCGPLSGTLAEATSPIEEVMAPAVTARVRRVLEGRKPEVLGRFTQALTNNWKLYAENVRASCHESLPHLFFTTFEVNRLTRKGGLIVSGRGGSHVSWSAIEQHAADSSYAAQGIRSDSAKPTRPLRVLVPPGGAPVGSSRPGCAHPSISRRGAVAVAESSASIGDHRKADCSTSAPAKGMRSRATRRPPRRR
jgi:hypothetical protein